jgi:hypothetical protein
MGVTVRRYGSNRPNSSCCAHRGAVQDGDLLRAAWNILVSVCWFGTRPDRVVRAGGDGGELKRVFGVDVDVLRCPQFPDRLGPTILLCFAKFHTRQSRQLRRRCFASEAFLLVALSLSLSLLLDSFSRPMCEI